MDTPGTAEKTCEYPAKLPAEAAAVALENAASRTWTWNHALVKPDRGSATFKGFHRPGKGLVKVAVVTRASDEAVLPAYKSATRANPAGMVALLTASPASGPQLASK